MSEPKVSWTDDGKFDVVRDLYSIYRDYMKHEDDLINQRSTWHLLIQGFLFATFGVMGEWQPESGAGFLNGHRLFLIMVLASTGMAIAVVACVSVAAAYLAIRRLCKGWEDAKADSSVSNLRDVFPGIAGAGGDWIKRCGIAAATVTPVLLVAAWLTILAVAIHSVHNPTPPQGLPVIAFY